MPFEQDVRRFIVENFEFDTDTAGPANDESLTQRGVLDSTGVLELIMFLEQRYGITIDDTETLPENFDTIDSIVRFLRVKGAGSDTSYVADANVR